MQTFNLDLSAKRVIPLLNAKQRNAGMKILVRLKDNKEKYTVPDGVTWSVWYSGANGEGNYDKIDDRDAVVVDVDAGTATVELIYQMLDNPGPGEMCLVMKSANGTQLGLWNIPYFVEALPGADSKAAKAYYQAFLQAQENAEDAADRAEKAAKIAEAGISVIVGIDEGNQATHTASEIYNAIQGKQTVIFHHTGRLDNEFISLKMANPNMAVFSKPGYPTEFDIFNIEIDAQGTVSYKTSSSSELVDQAVEKVETDKKPISYLPQAASEEQKIQARENIGATTIKEVVDKTCPAFEGSGAAVTCEPVEGYPLGVVSRIEPVQSGTGDPRPENSRPISGYNKVKLTRCGKNLLNVAENLAFTGYVEIKSPIPAGTYTLTWANETHGGSVYPYVRFQDNNTGTRLMPEYNGRTIVLAKDETTVYVYSNDYNAGASVGVSATISQFMLSKDGGEYEPYRGETFTLDFGQTVYGGTLDWNTGVLTMDSKLVTLTGQETLGGNGISYVYIDSFKDAKLGPYSRIIGHCSHAPQDTEYPDMVSDQWVCHSNAWGGIQFRKLTDNWGLADWDAETMRTFLVEQYAAGTPVQFTYTLANPITIQLTPQEILALSGINTLYSDTGDTEVTGRADPATIINNLQNRLAALEAAVINNA